MDINYATHVETMADRIPDKPALIFGEKITSYREFEVNASRISQFLSDQGLQRDSMVGLFLFNCPEYMEATLAAYKMRGIPINVNYRYRGDELAYVLEDSEAEALVFHSSLANQVMEVKDRLPKLKTLICVSDDGTATPTGVVEYQQLLQTVEPAPRIERSSDDTLMLYTGGTTGMPKGVAYRIGEMLSSLTIGIPMFFQLPAPGTHEELVDMAVELANNSAPLVSLPASPLMHTAAIVNSGIQIQLFGGAMVILQSRSFDPRELWTAVQEHNVNHIVIVGDTFAKPMLDVLDEDQQKGISYDISSLKMLVSSGVMFSKQSKERLLDYGDMFIIDGAGASEGVMAAQLSSRQNPPTDTGNFIAMPTTQIFNEDYQMLPRGCGEVGLIGVSGTLPKGYYKDDAKSANTFRTIDGTRWGFTGDMGSIDENGFLTFKGRGSNCINTGGEKVFPEEVEEVLKQHEKVLDCLVVGLPNERFGESVAAVVSVKEQLNSPEQELKEFASTMLAGYKLPRAVKVVDKVQRAPNGKADYKWAKACFE